MFNKILVAIHPNNDAEGKRALAEGLRLLTEGGNLHLVSVFNPSGAGFFPHVIEEEPEVKEKQILHRLELLGRRYLPLNLEASVHVLSGPPGEQLVALAAELKADLIILTSRGAGSRWPLRRATVEHIAVCAPCSVLVLQDTADELESNGE